MPFAKINGIELYYETHGSGPALVFAHGGEEVTSVGGSKCQLLPRVIQSLPLTIVALANRAICPTVLDQTPLSKISPHFSTTSAFRRRLLQGNQWVVGQCAALLRHIRNVPAR